MKFTFCLFLTIALLLLSTGFSKDKEFPKAIYIELIIPTEDSIGQRSEGLVLMDSVMYYENSALSNKFVAKRFRCYEEKFSSSWAYYQGIKRADLNNVIAYFKDVKSKGKYVEGQRRLRVCDIYGSFSRAYKGDKAIRKVVEKLKKLKTLSKRSLHIISSWEEFK